MALEEEFDFEEVVYDFKSSTISAEEIIKKRGPDFIFCIGDDTSDEEMFKFFKRKKNLIKKYLKNPVIYTATVGKKPSQAESYVQTIGDVKSLMEAFMQLSLKKKLSCSSFDIRSLDLHKEENIQRENSKIFEEKKLVEEIIGDLSIEDNFEK